MPSLHAGRLLGERDSDTESLTKLLVREKPCPERVVAHRFLAVTDRKSFDSGWTGEFDFVWE